ncbi:MAG TPA: hypothetical protein VFZ63_06095 [Jiangellaceae bacterium]
MKDLLDKSKNPSGWAIGGLVFAAMMMVLVGLFQFFQGLAAILDDQFFVVIENYAFELDLTAWGWIHLILGVILVASGLFLFAGSTAAGAVAVVLAGLSALTNFFFIPYYPFWSIVMIALAIYVIWAITRAGVFDT